MANLSRPITREEPELRSILPKADSDPDDFMGRICQKASGTGADPIQSGEAGWQFSRGGVLGRARAPRPRGLASTLPGSALWEGPDAGPRKPPLLALERQQAHITQTRGGRQRKDNSRPISYGDRCQSPESISGKWELHREGPGPG